MMKRTFFTSLSHFGPRAHGMRGAFKVPAWSPTDIHVKKAMELFSVGIEDVTKEMRHFAKERNFFESYGIRLKDVLEAGSVSEEDADRVVDAYMKKYPAVASILDTSKTRRTCSR